MAPWLDRLAARRGFDRASGDNVLAREVESRLAERLAYIKATPRRVVDAGCGRGASRACLRARYADAQILGVDGSVVALRDARAPDSWLQRARVLLNVQREFWLAADMAALPLSTGSCGLIWSNLALAWADDPLMWLREWHRVLEPDGLLMFSTYGPDTLKELRSAFAEVDDAPHVHPFVDMHDLGDMLVSSGFADPVMDMEMFTLTYPTVPAVFAELRSLGLGNAHCERRRSLTGRNRWANSVARYAALEVEGRVPATFEIVYGHAWKAAPRALQDGRQIIRFSSRAN